jgi:tripartite-type tricarboxylate transporter receptor subunit TctC
MPAAVTTGNSVYPALFCIVKSDEKSAERLHEAVKSAAISAKLTGLGPRPRPQPEAQSGAENKPGGNPMRTFAVACAVLSFLLSFNSASRSQTYPDRAITVIVPYAPGGNTDVIARIVLEGMGQILGQRFVIENIGGAGGTTGSARGARATPDGYTLLVGQMGTHAASVGLYGDKLPYHPLTDFEHVTQFTDTPIGVFVKKDFPARSLQELVAILKKDAPKLSNGHGGVGATSHVSCLLFTALVGARSPMVAYRGSGPALNDLITGQYDFLCDQIPHTIGHVEAGSIRILAVAQTDRASVLPNVPTTVESGMPQFQASGWNAMFAPKGTPKAMVDKLADAASKALDDPATRKRLQDIGAIVPPRERRGPQALRDFVASEIDKWTPVIKASGVALN